MHSTRRRSRQGHELTKIVLAEQERKKNNEIGDEKYTVFEVSQKYEV